MPSVTLCDWLLMFSVIRINVMVTVDLSVLTNKWIRIDVHSSISVLPAKDWLDLADSSENTTSQNHSPLLSHTGMHH